ncbi:MAG TPA: ChbG/HpnK family deacetylase [Chloroflexota bacterium]|nr:ChbG/HpnK family deacetylase [Chloroflexota bacterium]
MSTTAERLGYPADAKLLIVNGDDIGMCHAANVATVAGLTRGLLTAASLMVPCPWALEAVELAAGLDVGVHLTITAEWRTYRWGPMTAAGRDPHSGLVDPEGCYWHRGAPIHEHGDPRAARAEAEAQVEWALARGVDVTKLDDHMGVFGSHPDFLVIYVDLARRYRLPLRLGAERRLVERGQSALAEVVMAARAELLAPDHMAGLPLSEPERLEGFMIQAIRGLKPGVTEFVLHAAAAGDELTAIAPDAAARVEAHRLVVASEPVRRAVETEGIKLIGYRELREALRAGA